MRTGKKKVRYVFIDEEEAAAAKANHQKEEDKEGEENKNDLIGSQNLDSVPKSVKNTAFDASRLSKSLRERLAQIPQVERSSNSRES